MPFESWHRKRVATCLGAIVLSIWIPVAIDQAYFRYNTYILPVVGLAAIILYLGLLRTSKPVHGYVTALHARFAGKPLPYLVIVGGCMGLIILLVGGGEWLAIRASEAHVARIRKIDEGALLAHPANPSKVGLLSAPSDSIIAHSIRPQPKLTHSPNPAQTARAVATPIQPSAQVYGMQHNESGATGYQANGPDAHITVQVNPSAEYIGPDTIIRSALSSKLATVREKYPNYPNRDIQIVSVAEAGNTQGRRIANLIGLLLTETHLGSFGNGTYVGTYPDAPVTAVCEQKILTSQTICLMRSLHTFQREL
jgi:hypothetical protein